MQTRKYLDADDVLMPSNLAARSHLAQYTRRGLWPQAAFWVLCLFCNMQIVAFSEIYPQRAQ